MRIKRTIVAAIAVAMTASVGALAQKSPVPTSPNVVPGEVIYVKPNSANQYRGYAVTEKDAALLNEALNALASIPDTNGTLLVIVASNGKLSVNGLTNTAPQAAVIEKKLKGLRGGTKVTTFFDYWNSASN